jgi:RNA polymerase sigma factor (sigma-70 family)
MAPGPTPEAELVAAARAGDTQAMDALLGTYLPLIYNIVGRALDAPTEVDDVVQDVMLQMVRDLRQLRDPSAFRSWLVAIAMRQVRGHWRQRRSVPVATELENEAMADLGADFVDLTIAALGLSDQRKEVAEATRWLEAEDRQILTLWWLEAAGQLTRAELSAALESSPARAAVIVHRTKTRLGSARMVVRALAASPRCTDLETVCRRWDGRPNAQWRKHIARHVRECPTCSALQLDMVPAEKLLVGLALVPVPLALHAAAFPSAAAAATTATSATATTAMARHGIRLARRIRPHHAITHWTALPVKTKAVVAVSAVFTLVAGSTGITYATKRHPPAVVVVAPTAAVTSATSASAAAAATSAASSSAPSATASQASSTIVNTALPIRAAFYYPWTSSNWGALGAQGSHYMPSAGHYVDDSATVDRQIRDMQYGGLQAAIASWSGSGTSEDAQTPLFMSEVAKLGFSWTIQYKQESLGDPAPAEIIGDLSYLRRYSDQPTWLHINGLPVIFVSASATDAWPRRTGPPATTSYWRYSAASATARTSPKAGISIPTPRASKRATRVTCRRDPGSTTRQPRASRETPLSSARTQSPSPSRRPRFS